jgi:hypothetical protein
VKLALAHAPVTEDAQRHEVLAPHLGRDAEPDRQRQVRGNDGVPAEKPFLDVVQVHRAAAPARDARGLAEQLRHHPVRVEPPCQGVPVVAVVRQDLVLRLEARD